jgi:hypothetical protein
VLTAFQQVEDYLAAVRILSQQIVRQKEAVEHSETYLKLEQARYDTGIDPYIDLAVAQTTLYGNQQGLAELQIQQMTASVELIEALGGGWDKSQLPTPAQITAEAVACGDDHSALEGRPRNRMARERVMQSASILVQKPRDDFPAEHQLPEWAGAAQILKMLSRPARDRDILLFRDDYGGGCPPKRKQRRRIPETAAFKSTRPTGSGDAAQFSTGHGNSGFARRSP